MGRQLEVFTQGCPAPIEEISFSSHQGLQESPAEDSQKDGTLEMPVFEGSCLKYRFLGPGPGLMLLDLQGLGLGLYLKVSDDPSCTVNVWTP